MVSIISYGLGDLITFSISSAKDGDTVLMTSLQSMTLNFPECYQGWSTTLTTNVACNTVWTLPTAQAWR